MNLDEAILKHAEWKLKLRTAISKHEKLDVNTIGKDNCCDLGKWLYGEGKKHAQSASYTDLVVKHARFHQQAALVATEINAAEFSKATQMLANETPYAVASSSVAMAIQKLKKEIAA